MFFKKDSKQNNQVVATSDLGIRRKNSLKIVFVTVVVFLLTLVLLVEVFGLKKDSNQTQTQTEKKYAYSGVIDRVEVSQKTIGIAKEDDLKNDVFNTIYVKTDNGKMVAFGINSLTKVFKSNFNVDPTVKTGEVTWDMLESGMRVRLVSSSDSNDFAVLQPVHIESVMINNDK